MKFYKYQGAGNDFVIIDNREGVFPKNNLNLISKLCDRHFGIGADGLMLIENQAGFDFKMVYFNADGRESSMCGNGGRCIVQCCHFLEIIGNECNFLAIDGAHEAKIEGDNILLKMIDVKHWETLNSCYIIDTGSPHYIDFNLNPSDDKLIAEAQKIRYNDRFKSQGINVNFVEEKEKSLYVRTYERGVENETLACGTGVTAVALAAHLKNNALKSPICIETKGGELFIYFEKKGDEFVNIWLKGPGVYVFEGEFDLKFFE